MALVERVYNVCRRYGWLAVAIGISLLTGMLWFVFFRRVKRKHTLQSVVEVELAGIRAEEALEKRLAGLARDKAIADVEYRYEREKTELETYERIEAEELRNDPVALSGLLARAGARRAYERRNP